MTELQFAAGDLVFAEGSPSTFVLRIGSGEAEVFTVLEGREVVLGRVKPGDYVGEMGVIRGLPRSASVRAVKDLTVERFTRDAFMERLGNDGAMALQLLERLSDRLNVLDQAFAKASLGPPDKAEPEAAAGPPAGGRLTLRAGDPLLAAALPGTKVVLDPLPFTVGRTPGPGEAVPPVPIDLPLDDSRPYRLSRAHFRVTRSGGGYRVQDIGSVLGTLVNGTPIGQPFGTDSAPLKMGENEILAGGADTRFRFLVTLEPA